jgi:hypothetical protein
LSWTVPWDDATIIVEDKNGVEKCNMTIDEGYYSCGGLPTGGNPYTVIGTATVFGDTFGKTVGGVYVSPGSTISVNLIMTSPPS